MNNLGFHPWVRNINLNPTGCPSQSYLTAARMGLSAAEKQKRYRERKKAETGHDAMKKRDAERKRNARQKDTQAERKKERERKQKLRAKRKAEKADHAPYSARASLSRAVETFENCGKTGKEIPHRIEDEVPQQTPPTNKTTPDVIQSVKDFYLRSDISWTAPGRKDSITVIRDGTKVKEQRHYLTMSIKEAYALYKQEFPDENVGLSTFKTLRPDVVLCQKAMPHNVCVCQYHENVNLLLQLLVCIGMPGNHHDLLAAICCDSESEECMTGSCNACNGNTTSESLSEWADDDKLTELTTWYQWIRDEDGKTAKVQVSGTVSDALESLSEKLPPFKIHSFIKNKQAAEFQAMYTAPRPNHAVLQIDFSENAAIIEQDEVQSAHWAHTQVTIFTAVAWSQEGSHSFCITSDTMAHDKYAAAVFIEHILDELQSLLTDEIKELDIFSDGAAQHFKQKYIFSFVSSLLRTKQIRVNWHFFATSHGKGAVDGIGGAVKRTVFTAIKNRRHNVKYAQWYTECARSLLGSTTILYISNETISSKKAELDDLWANVLTVPGTHGIHCVRTVSEGCVNVSTYSAQNGKEHFLFLQRAHSEVDPIPSTSAETHGDQNENVSIQISAGKWYAVFWEATGYWFLGQALNQHATQEDCWVFSFLEQVDADKNIFKLVKDIDSAHKDIVFLEVYAPAPSSSTRKNLLKLCADDFAIVGQKFHELF